MTTKLKPYPKYKDSDVEWLGDVPQEWDVNRVKSHFKIKKRIAKTLGYDVLSITQRGIVIKDIESGEGQLSMDYAKYQLIYPDEFGMNYMDLLTGFVDLSKYIGVISPDYRVFCTINDENTNSQYYLRIFQTCYANKIFYKYGQGSSQLGRWRLPTNGFETFYIPVPPLQEQTTIATYLDTQTAKIDTLIKKSKQAIELLKEKRTALITAAVTGKIDVRECV